MVPILFGCSSSATEPGLLDLELEVRTLGLELDVDGYLFAVDGQPGVVLPSNGTVPIPPISRGSHSFAILGIAANCRATSSGTSGTFEATPDQTTLQLEVFCLKENPGRIFYTTAFQRIRVLSALGGEAQELPLLGNSVSPTHDGQRITYDFEGDIWLADANGLNPVNLTSTPEFIEALPQWSPDGLAILYHGLNLLGPDQLDVYRMNADGSGVMNLTPDTPNSADGEPDWSPDGTKIVFRSERTGTGDLYTMNADGSNVARLTEGNLDSGAKWSPDGQRILFARFLDPLTLGAYGTGYELFVINTDGTGLTQLTTDPNFRTSHCDWSPDGDWLVVGSGDINFEGGYDLYSMRPDGTDAIRLTFSELAGLPTWIP
jgi:dipeptidyl aminopeptidase/acylaminoacyl peptidase